MKRQKGSVFALTVALMIVCCGSSVWFGVKGEMSSLFPALFAFCGIGVCYLVYGKWPALLDTKMYLAITLFIFASSLLGSSFGLYDVPHYDDYLHVGSGVITCILAFSLFGYLENRGTLHMKGLFVPGLLAVVFVMGLGAFWEMYEFLSDLLIHTDMQAGGNTDTMVDLIDAFCGMAITLPFCLQGWRKRKSEKR